MLFTIIIYHIVYGIHHIIFRNIFKKMIIYPHMFEIIVLGTYIFQSHRIISELFSHCLGVCMRICAYCFQRWLFRGTKTRQSSNIAYCKYELCEAPVTLPRLATENFMVICHYDMHDLSLQRLAILSLWLGIGYVDVTAMDI